MNSIYLYLGIQLVLFLFQMINSLKLELFQYCELLIGSLFIILFFGIFASLLTLNTNMINYSIIFASFYSLWYYLTKKITNYINSDSNGVIYYS